jgi:TIR domain-containing protein
MAHDVFVSHSEKDKAVADAVVARLEAESVTCWTAPRDIVPGADCQSRDESEIVLI